MSEQINWRTLQAEGQDYAEKQIAEAAKKDSVSKDFYGAALLAMHSTKQDGLHPSINEYGESKYTIQQGLKAACHTREDVAATLIIQQSILRRLQGLNILGWLCFAILCYIAFQVS